MRHYRKYLDANMQSDGKNFINYARYHFYLKVKIDLYDEEKHLAVSTDKQ